MWDSEIVLSGQDRTTIHHKSGRCLRIQKEKANLDTLVLRTTKDGLKVGRVDKREDITHIFGGVDGVEMLEVIRGPDLARI
jgi:hypothetical protein